MRNYAALQHTPTDNAVDPALPDVTTRFVPATGEPAQSGVFEAGLFYIAADLQDLAAKAPPHKRDALLAIVGLVRAVAEN